MPFDLSVRLTDKYVGEYQHLDQWATIGEYERIATGEHPSDDPDDYCESVTYYHTIRVTPDPTTSIAYDAAGKPIFLHRDETIRRALLDSFTDWGCAHDWDCCGCRSFLASSAHRLGDSDLWTVIVHSSRNF